MMIPRVKSMPFWYVKKEEKRQIEATRHAIQRLGAFYIRTHRPNKKEGPFALPLTAELPIYFNAPHKQV